MVSHILVVTQRKPLICNSNAPRRAAKVDLFRFSFIVRRFQRTFSSNICPLDTRLHIGTRTGFFSAAHGESANAAKTARNLEQLSSCKVIKRRLRPTDNLHSLKIPCMTSIKTYFPPFEHIFLDFPQSAHLIQNNILRGGGGHLERQIWFSIQFNWTGLGTRVPVRLSL